MKAEAHCRRDPVSMTNYPRPLVVDSLMLSGIFIFNGGPVFVLQKIAMHLYGIQREEGNG